MRTSNVAGLVAGLMVMIATGQAMSHEMYLKSGSYFFKPKSEASLTLVNGTFDKSSNSIPRNRMQDVSVFGAGNLKHPAASNWSDANDSSYLNFVTEEAGTHVAGVSTKPTVIEMKTEDFRNYLKLEGIPDTLASFDQGPPLEKVRERYSKHVRAIFQVGEKRSSDFSKTLGYPVEVILKNNPYQLKVGDEVSFQVLFKEMPVENQFINVGHSGLLHAYQLRTDKSGMAKFKITDSSIWYISLIYMQKVNALDADYESNWATVTFQVK